MCLIVFAYKHHPDYPHILAANRDEFYDRPTSSAHFWEDHPEVLAGRDLLVLEPIEAGVDTVVLEQLAVRADLADDAMVEYDDTVGVADCR